MTIDTQEILRYLQAEKQLFEAWEGRISDKASRFNIGVIAGLDLVKNYLLVYEEHEGKQIAKERGGK